eukprot:TRINITY_DN4476_c0_g2_i2.p1 TRINITY_DN4476_c0_g2~~TRINITY_DN4476_c0_g2_i2.p1  ORF type:complete len:915 (-),score=212.17 TRINITY_DN4476_c0_g2_i2:88-2832(-)
MDEQYFFPYNPHPDPKPPPHSYTSRTQYEDLVIEYIENFRRQFLSLYPSRPTLYLCPSNEHGVEKFITSFIRPSKLPFKELYDAKGAASFIADHIEYEELSYPAEFPSVLRSPTDVLKDKRGNCFEISILLVSMLIGNGYDAYCVSGTANIETTTLDLTSQTCPLLTPPPVEIETAVQHDLSPYDLLIAKRPLLSSQFQKRKEQKKRESEASLSNSENSNDSSPSQKDPYHGYRLHCWVLVLPPKRDVENAFFIESTTGTIYPLSESNYSHYISIESVWNDSNYWVNMQQPKLSHTILPTQSNSNINNINPLPSIASRLSSIASFSQRPSTVLSQNSPKQSIVQRPSFFTNMQSSPSQALPPIKSKAEPKYRSVEVKDIVFDMGDPSKWEPVFISDASQDEQDNSQVLRAPNSWVEKLHLNKETYQERYPNGRKTIHYCGCTVEYFSEYNRSDGMVKRLYIYKDKTNTQLVEEREVFANRKDFLSTRSKFPLDNKVSEQFSRGSSSGLKEHTYIYEPLDNENPIEKREMHFYPGFRLDGLILREEFVGRKIAETYADRDDLMVYRSATFADPSYVFSNSPPSSAVSTARTIQTTSSKSIESAVNPANNNTVLKLNDSEKALPIRKMSQKFARNVSIAADDDVQKLTFHIDQKKIVIRYHLGEGRITSSTRVYTKDGKAKGFQVDPFHGKPTPRQLYEDYQRFLSLERDCIARLRDTDREALEILQLRETQENYIELNVSIYDINRNKSLHGLESTAISNAARLLGRDSTFAGGVSTNMGAENRKKERRGEVDYLAPYLHSLPLDKPMTREIAVQVKEACLKAMRDRLVQKYNLIQSRLEKENSALQKRQKAREIDKTQNTPESEEEYERFVQETSFRIKILEQRLARHQKQGVEKFTTLESKLANDSRLAEFLR